MRLSVDNVIKPLQWIVQRISRWTRVYQIWSQDLIKRSWLNYSVATQTKRTFIAHLFKCFSKETSCFIEMTSTPIKTVIHLYEIKICNRCSQSCEKLFLKCICTFLFLGLLWTHTMATNEAPRIEVESLLDENKFNLKQIVCLKVIIFLFIIFYWFIFFHFLV